MLSRVSIRLHCPCQLSQAGVGIRSEYWQWLCSML